MTNTLTRAYVAGTTAGAVLYTVPADSVITVIGMMFSNVSDEATDFTLILRNSSGDFTLLPKNIPLSARSGYAPSEVGKLVLTAGDSLILKAAVDNSVNGHISFLLQA